MFANHPEPKKTTHNRLGRALLERDVENYGRKEFKKIDWMFEKFTSPQKRSVPDDLCACYELVFFIEFKRPGKKATTKQRKDHEKRRAKKLMVFVVDCYEQLDLVIEIIRYCELMHTSLTKSELPPYLLI